MLYKEKSNQHGSLPITNSFHYSSWLRLKVKWQSAIKKLTNVSITWKKCNEEIVYACTNTSRIFLQIHVYTYCYILQFKIHFPPFSVKRMLIMDVFCKKKFHSKGCKKNCFVYWIEHFAAGRQCNSDFGIKLFE